MTTRQQTPESRQDARLTLGVATACGAAYAAFVVLPYYAADDWLPAGLESLWALCGLLTVFLAPLAAGLAGYVSLLALWLRGDILPTTVRRLHLVTLLVVAALLVALASSWGSGVVSWWLD